MKRVFFVCMIIFILSVVTFAQDKQYLSREVKRIDRVCKNIEINGPVKPVHPQGLHAKMGDGVVWCLDNIVRSDGWQLTGWSKLKLDVHFNLHRFKFGFITSEIQIAERLGENLDHPNWKENERWRQNHSSTVIGVHWTCYFSNTTMTQKEKKSDVEQLIDSAKFYESLHSLRGQKSALYTYNKIVKQYPNYEKILDIQKKISYLSLNDKGVCNVKK